MVLGTLYDPAVHGAMTKEERSEYNRKILNEIPERNSDDFCDYRKYCLLIDAGYVDEAQPFKAGYVRWAQWSEIDREKRRKRLYTQEEFDWMIEQERKDRERFAATLRKVGLKAGRDLVDDIFDGE